MEYKYVPLVPYMPLKPELANGYVPYQLNTTEYSLEEAMKYGTLYSSLYSEYIGDVKGDSIVCECKMN